MQIVYFLLTLNIFVVLTDYVCYNESAEGIAIRSASPLITRLNRRKHTEEDDTMTFNFKYEKGAKVYGDTRAYTEKRLSKLDRYFRSDSDASVTFNEKRGIKSVEVTIKHGTMLFRAETSDQDYNVAVDRAVDALVRQIHKNKTKLEKRLRQGAFDAAEVDAEPVPDTVEDELDIVRTKRFALKPMTPEDAVLQMNMLGHQFYVFRDSTRNEAIEVVYLRKDGGYGLIETE